VQLGLAQIYDPVDWSFKSIQISKDQYELIFIADMDKGWSIYSQYLEREDGPIPTSFYLEKGDHFSKISKNEECDFNKKEAYDKLFSMKLVKFSNKAYFIQKIKVTNPSVPITGYLEYMTCDDTKCLPPALVDFEFDLSQSLEKETIKYSRNKLCLGSQSFVNLNIQLEENNTMSSNNRNLNSHSEIIREETSDKQQIAEPHSKSKKKETSKALKSNIPGWTSKQKEALAGKAEEITSNEIFEPVSWIATLNSMGNNEFHLEFEANIAEGWHMYSKDIVGDDGLVPTRININFNRHYKALETLKESAAQKITEYDPYLYMDLTKLKQQVIYEQSFEVIDERDPLDGFIEIMVCDASKCIQQTTDFTIDTERKQVLLGVIDDELSDGSKIHLTSTNSMLEDMYGLSVGELQEPLGSCGEKEEEKKTLWSIFLLGIIGGLVALLTPCVFPMIPLTVSFFTKSAEKGKGMAIAAVYGASIFLIYVLLSVPFHLMDAVDPNILNNISTNVWLNIFFFAIFVFFAFSFFGYYELTLPSRFTNRISAAEGVGGFIGVFFMALTLALVSFSCTGPILGSLLAGTLSSDGGAIQLTSGMAGFGIALALPFGLFAAFPSLMNKLPKSGGWLNTVKVILGFLELALAFKFLSNADLVKQWGILKIEPFLIIWFLCALGLTLYLFGKIKFPHDSPIKKLSFGRIALGVVAAVMTVYLVSGFRYSDKAGTYKSLTLLSGLAPPVCYSWIYDCKCPQGLECFKELEEGLAHAKAVNKPVLLDFTGHACVNCREMEENVWPEPEVYPLLKNDYVLISLYVDEKISLPEKEQITIERKTGGKKKLRYTGDRWQVLQTEYFGKNTQPLYVLMTPDGQLLNNPTTYTPDASDYAEFLECGLRNFKSIGMK
jgi:thiol:disulfide interchange protein DsbD